MNVGQPILAAAGFQPALAPQDCSPTVCYCNDTVNSSYGAQ